MATYPAETSKRPALTVTQKILRAMQLLPEIRRRASERQNLGPLGRYAEMEEKGKAAALAARRVGVSARSVELAIQLRRDHPDLFKEVERGELDLYEAKRKAAGKPPKPKKLRPENDDEYRVPNRLRDRLTAAMNEVGGDSLGDGVEALLDFIEGKGSATWKQWAKARRKTGQ